MFQQSVLFGTALAVALNSAVPCAQEIRKSAETADIESFDGAVVEQRGEHAASPTGASDDGLHSKEFELDLRPAFPIRRYLRETKGVFTGGQGIAHADSLPTRSLTGAQGSKSGCRQPGFGVRGITIFGIAAVAAGGGIIGYHYSDTCTIDRATNRNPSYFCTTSGAVLGWIPLLVGSAALITAAACAP